MDEVKQENTHVVSFLLAGKSTKPTLSALPRYPLFSSEVKGVILAVTKAINATYYTGLHYK